MDPFGLSSKSEAIYIHDNWSLEFRTGTDRSGASRKHLRWRDLSYVDWRYKSHPCQTFEAWLEDPYGVLNKPEATKWSMHLSNLKDYAVGQVYFAAPPPGWKIELKGRSQADQTPDYGYNPRGYYYDDDHGNEDGSLRFEVSYSPPFPANPVEESVPAPEDSCWIEIDCPESLN